ncbi:MAG: hypothetical protein LAT67_04120 [Balneolales bacterium]|nr:hypothetical protein [Balneolales bacterium]
MTLDQKRWLLIIAGTLMGSTFLFGDIGDGTRHYERVATTYVGMTFYQFFEIIGRLIMLKSAQVPGVNDDIYIHTISFVAGGIFQHPPLFWTIVSFIYSYFYINSLFKIYELYPRINYSFLFVYLFAIFLLLKSFEGIQFVRTWTGFWILFYGILQYQTSKKNKYLFFVFLIPPLIHIGFLVLALPAWLLIFVNTNLNYIKYSIIALFAISFIIPVNYVPLLDLISFTETGDSKIGSYYREGVGNRQILRLQRIGTRNFYAAFHSAGLTSFLILVISATMIVSGRYFKKFNSTESKLFSIGLLMQSFSNITPFLYAVSNRTAGIAIIFLLAAVSLNIKRSHYGIKNSNLNGFEITILTLCAICLSYFFLYRFAVIIQWLSAYFFFFPAIPILFEDANMTVREFLGPVFEPIFR